MPLRDHFRSPVNDKHHWSELHGQWPGEIVRTLFDLLPPGFRASPRVYIGSRSFEVDVSTTEDDGRDPAPVAGSSGPAVQAALSPTFMVSTDLTEFDEYEVRVYDDERERTLVAAIEIVSPSNKDRPEHRNQFVSKVAALLREDVCVAVVDVVSIRRANLYADLLTRIGRIDPQLAPTPPALYAVTLRGRKPPRQRLVLDAWFYPMAVGDPLPTIPLWLSPDSRVMLPLEPSYQETCRLLRIG